MFKTLSMSFADYFTYFEGSSDWHPQLDVSDMNSEFGNCSLSEWDDTAEYSQPEKETLPDGVRRFAQEDHQEDLTRLLLSQPVEDDFFINDALFLLLKWVALQPDTSVRDQVLDTIQKNQETGRISEERAAAARDYLTRPETVGTIRLIDLAGNRWKRSSAPIPPAFEDRFDASFLPLPHMFSSGAPDVRRVTDVLLPRVFGHGTTGMESMGNIILEGQINPSNDGLTYLAPLNTRVYQPAKQSAGVHGPFYVLFSKDQRERGYTVNGAVKAPAHFAYVMRKDQDKDTMRTVLNFFQQQGYITAEHAKQAASKLVSIDDILHFSEKKTAHMTPETRQLLTQLFEINQSGS